ncbi:branched-chain amino acid aminotransferase [Sutcliffiella deserti]|uniref:branched-chain amino acid aminotransferase n=1 Tax=Sutcliffiella deserti TaxID=2875501 RepID=UPI001CBB178E|nr:branched-chain amino acid aminotransferase [Sutcliffiella deserti]
MEMKQLDFTKSYIERCDKETENTLAEEKTEFLEGSIQYLKEHKGEFIYLEAPDFEELGVEAVSLELDDVFGTYSVLLGLKLKKKYQATIKSYFLKVLQENKSGISLIFNQGDGLWDINFGLNHAEDFHEDITIREAYSLIYSIVYHVVKAVEKE